MLRNGQRHSSLHSPVRPESAVTRKSTIAFIRSRSATKEHFEGMYHRLLCPKYNELVPKCRLQKCLLPLNWCGLGIPI